MNPLNHSQDSWARRHGFKVWRDLEQFRARTERRSAQFLAREQDEADLDDRTPPDIDLTNLTDQELASMSPGDWFRLGIAAQGITGDPEELEIVDDDAD